MPRGGSRPGAGRTPEPGSLAEAARLEGGLIKVLPRVRAGDTPTWPLARPSAREKTVWAELWKLPQARVWDEQFMHRQVAMYVRTSVEAEKVGVPAARRTLLLQQENVLLLNPAALLKAGYRISTDDRVLAATGTEQAPPPPVGIPSARGRLRAVPNVGADA